MSKIKYVSSSGLTHYDEKIKKVIDEVDTSTNTKVTQTPTSTDASYPLLLSPSGQTQETNTTSYFNSGVVLNPSTKTISANIDGNAKTATKATQDASGNVITDTYARQDEVKNLNPKYGVSVADLSSNSSQNTLILVCEVNYGSVTKMYMEGTIMFVNHQWDNTPNEYYKYTTDVHFDKHNSSITLFSSNNNNLKPAIVKYTNPNDEADIKYYFALLFTKGNHNWNKIIFNGIYNTEILKTWISYSGTTLPDGYEIYQEALPMRKLNLVSGYVGNGSNSYSYADIKAIEDRVAEKASISIYGDTVVSMGRKADTTVGENSFAFGNNVTASGYYSHAEGNSTTALTNQHAQGHYNNTTNATANSTSGTSDGTAFVIGNGTSSSKSNAFRVRGDGVIYATNATVQTGADYAEYFEWSDGNPNEEDRVGYFVTFDEDNPEKIRIANENDYILGIVSGMPNIIGNGDECWKQRYILDDFGRYIEETFEYEVEVPEVVEKEVEDEETGETKIVEEVVIHKETKIGTKWKENPEYDQTKAYIPRDERAEWSAIGMLGVLSVRDDGTCQVNGYCKCIDGGIATACEKGEGAYRVIKRVTDNIVKVVLK